MSEVKVTSKMFWLNARDFIRGMLIAVGTAVFTVLQASLEAGQLKIEWKTMTVVGLAAATTYLLKNFFTPASVQKTITNDQVDAAKAGNIEPTAK